LKKNERQEPDLPNLPQTTTRKSKSQLYRNEPPAKITASTARRDAVFSGHSDRKEIIGRTHHKHSRNLKQVSFVLKWTRITFHDHLPKLSSHTSLSLSSDLILFLGGDGFGPNFEKIKDAEPMSSVYVASLAYGSVIKFKSLIDPISAHSSVHSQNRVIVFGGLTAGNKFSSKLQCIDFDLGVVETPWTKFQQGDSNGHFLCKNCDVDLKTLETDADLMWKKQVTSVGRWGVKNVPSKYTNLGMGNDGTATPDNFEFSEKKIRFAERAELLATNDKEKLYSVYGDENSVWLKENQEMQKDKFGSLKYINKECFEKNKQGIMQMISDRGGVQVSNTPL
jgi:hypothetical protein